jgi:spore germination protein
LAKAYGVAPIMFASAISEEGIVSREVTNEIIINPAFRKRLIDNALRILETKGYYGINIHLEGITNENLEGIAEYIRESAVIFHSEGYKIAITITPMTNINTPKISFEKINYSKLSEYVDGISFTSYEWARTYGYPSSIFPVYALREFWDYAVSIIPSESIFLGITRLNFYPCKWE